MDINKLVNAITTAEKSAHAMPLDGRMDVSSMPFKLTPQLVQNLDDEFILSSDFKKLMSHTGKTVGEVIQILRKSTLGNDKVFQSSSGDICEISNKTSNKTGNKDEILDKIIGYIGNAKRECKINGDYQHLEDLDFLNGTIKINLGEKGLAFEAHGIAKGLGYGDMVRQLDKLLTDGINPNKRFFFAPLDVPASKVDGYGPAFGTPGGTAYRTGPFILVSGKDKSIVDDGIKYVILNSSMAPMIEEFKKAYPKVEFIDIEHANEFFSKL